MRFGSSRTRTALALALTAALPLTMPPLCHAQGNVTPAAPSAATPNAALPAQATITAVQGQQVTLGIGADDGAQPGAIYGVSRAGKVGARLRVTAVRAADSTATIVGADEDFIVAVGDTAQFIALQPIPVTPPTVTPVTPPIAVTPTPVTPVTPNVPISPTTPTIPIPANPGTVVTPVAATSGALTSATISALNGDAVTLSAGSDQGVRTASTVPVLRNGNVIALVKIQTTSQTASTGTVIWHDPTDASLIVGDSVALLPGTGVGAQGIPGVSTGPGSSGPVQTIHLDHSGPEQAAVPATPILYETGASNAVVPHTDLAYQYLATLAAARLITRYPANVFYNDGARYHRTEEDINFTRAQIADLIREALTSEGTQDAPGRVRVALSALTQRYGPELRKLGVEATTLAPFTAPKGFAFGYSGQNIASLVGGTTKNAIEPFSERQGGRRTRSGFDSQVNIFGQSGDKLNLFATVESNSAVRRGPNADSGLSLRRALVTYDAGRQIKGLSVTVGRNEVWWGPGHFGTLLLGDAAGPLNQLQTTFKRGSYQLQSLYAPLGNGPLGSSRSLYGHNLQVQLSPQARIGIAETLLTPTTSFDGISFAAAFSPFPLFTAERLRHRNTSAANGNSIIAAYLESSIANGFQGYGEFLADDIGVNNQNLVRNRIGSLVGVHLFTPKDPTYLGAYAEYANLQGRTYLGLQAISDADYYYHSRPLGYPVAPLQGSGLGGAESLRFNAYWRAKPKLRLEFGVELADLASEQPITTGARSRQQTLRFRAAYDLSPNLTLIARAQRVSTSQPNFVFGEPSISQRLFQIGIAQSF